jgi:hypothetical protein
MVAVHVHAFDVTSLEVYLTPIQTMRRLDRGDTTFRPTSSSVRASWVLASSMAINMLRCSRL